MPASCHVLLPERSYLSPAKLADVVAVRGRGGIGRDEFGGGIGTGAARLIIEPTLRTLETITPFRRCLAASVLGSGAVLDGAISEGVRVVMDATFEGDSATGARWSHEAADASASWSSL